MADATLTVNENKFHTGPTMWCSGSFNVHRSSPSDKNVRVTGTMTYRIASSSSYGTPPYVGPPRGLSMYVKSSGHTSSDTNGVYGFSRGGTLTENIDKTIEWTTGDLSLHVCCNWSGYHDCDKGYDDASVGSLNIGNLPYNPETPATNASNGKIFSTNNSSGGSSGRAISDKPDKEVWWTWDGAIPGTPSSTHGIKQYNIDINTVNDVSGAASISETQNYTKNKHVSLFTLCRSYGIRIGGTLYCWVNTQENSGSWLGRIYLGSIKMRKDGLIQYKNASGTTIEATKVYYKDSSGNTKKIRYATAKDGNGALHVIDVYTTLYE